MRQCSCSWRPVQTVSKVSARMYRNQPCPSMQRVDRSTPSTSTSISGCHFCFVPCRRDRGRDLQKRQHPHTTPRWSSGQCTGCFAVPTAGTFGTSRFSRVSTLESANRTSHSTIVPQYHSTYPGTHSTSRIRRQVVRPGATVTR